MEFVLGRTHVLHMLALDLNLDINACAMFVLQAHTFEEKLPFMRYHSGLRDV